MGQSKTSTYNQQRQSEPDFVSRWSRLKHEAAQAPQEAAEHKAADHKAISDEAAGKPGNADSGQVLTDADMPDVDSLTFDSVFSDFMSPGVSEELRKLALRKLFHNEVFNIRDGLDEYDGDYTQFEKLGGIVTADMHHQVEMEARRKAEQLLQDEEQQDDATSLDDIDSVRLEPDERQDAGITASDQNEEPNRVDAADAADEVEAVQQKASVPGEGNSDE